MLERLMVVVGGQFGSEGKGAITAHLAKGLQHTDLNIRVAGPNAGHTAYDPLGREWKLRQVPVGAVTSDCQLHIAAGSEVDLDVLMSEVTMLDAAGFQVSNRLWVHPQATVIENTHSQEEQGLVSTIGSTGKGIGAARADRALRQARTIYQLAGDQRGHWSGKGPWTPPISEVDPRYRDACLIEGTQGYGLGLHTENYPYVTSSDCRAIDFLAMAGVSPWSASHVEVYVVVRPYPIRVAGPSGSLAGETTWEALGLPVERTTVTNKIRRVGQWDPALVRGAVQANGGPPTVRLALTMLDQLYPQIRGLTSWNQVRKLDNDGTFVDIQDHLLQIEVETGAPIGIIGTGPETVIETPERLQEEARWEKTLDPEALQLIPAPQARR